MTRRGWGLVLVAATVLALAALASNATTMSQIEAEANTLLAVRRTISQLVNAGTVWAGLAVVSGWLVRRPVQAFAAGVAALLVALVVHYGVGLILGMFDPNVWTENRYYFTAAVVLGGPLGLVGAIARRPDLWGVVARLVVPAGRARAIRDRHVHQPSDHAVARPRGWRHQRAGPADGWNGGLHQGPRCCQDAAVHPRPPSNRRDVSTVLSAVGGKRTGPAASRKRPRGVEAIGAAAAAGRRHRDAVHGNPAVSL